MPGVRGAWSEPTSRLRLRWGSYRGRYLGGMLLIVAGALGLQGSNTWILGLLLQGTIAHAVGWSIMPARGWRRILAAMLGVTTIWLLLTGPLSVWMLSLPYIGWMLVRHRPLRSYLTVLFPIANGMLLPQFYREYPDMLPALSISMAVFVASAWLARVLAATTKPTNSQ